MRTLMSCIIPRFGVGERAYKSSTITQTVFGSNRYPLLTNGVYDPNLEARLWNLSLLWTGEQGLYNVWWKAWHEAIQKMRPIKKSWRLYTFIFLY